MIFFRHLFASLFYGSLYYNLNDEQYTERLSLIFFSLVFMVLGHQDRIPAMFESRLLFYRERGAKAYGAVPYWLANLCLQLPIVAANVFVFCIIEYHLAGLYNAPGHFVFFYLVMLMTSVIGLLICQLIAALSPSEQSAINFFPIVIYFTMAYSGFIIYIPTIPHWQRAWLPYASFYRWSFQALVLNELSGNSELSSSEYYIDTLGFGGYSRDFCFWLLPLFAMFFGLAEMLVLKFVSFEER